MDSHPFKWYLHISEFNKPGWNSNLKNVSFIILYKYWNVVDLHKMPAKFYMHGVNNAINFFLQHVLNNLFLRLCVASTFFFTHTSFIYTQICMHARVLKSYHHNQGSTHTYKKRNLFFVFCFLIWSGSGKWWRLRTFHHHIVKYDNCATMSLLKIK